MFNVLDFEGQPLIVIGDDCPSLSLLGARLELLTTRKMPGTPTAACLFRGLLAIARRGAIDFFPVGHLGPMMELGPQRTYDDYSSAREMIVVGAFLIVADEQRSLAVFAAAPSGVKKVAEDTLPKKLRRIAALGRWIFGASQNGSVYCWELADNGLISELGAFRCDSPIRAFCSVHEKLFYATAGGGLGVFSELNESEMVRLRDSLEQERLTLMPDRKVPSTFEWQIPDVFVDRDAIAVIPVLPPAVSRAVLQRARVTADRFAAILRSSSVHNSSKDRLSDIGKGITNEDLTAGWDSSSEFSSTDLR